jgi:hypothetical protein
MPQRTLKHQSPIQALQKWRTERPELFVNGSWPHPCGLSTKKGEKKPARMSNARFDELSTKLDIEEKLALLASMKSVACLLKNVVVNP